MIFKTLSSICWIFFLAGFSSCIPDAVVPTEKYGSLSLSIEKISGATTHAKIQEDPPRNFSNLVITIKDKEGNDTDYTLKSLQTYELQGAWLTEKIDLPVGDYQITTIHLTDTASNILYATPLKNSLLAKQTQRSLPLSIHIGNDSETGLNIEVISTENFSPQDFGFDPAIVQFKESFYFFVAFVKTKVDEIMEFLPGKIQVSSGNYSYQESLDAKLHRIVLPKGFDNFTVQIVTDNYSTYENNFSYDNLLLYSSTPLIIEFQRNTGPECLGGSHVGDVVLLSQEDVDDFGKKCYTKIEGSLQIGNLSSNEAFPIIDLSPLETLREITQDLKIINNPDLNSLMGLQYLESANGHVQLEKNERLESLKGLRRLNAVNSVQITANHSLTDLDGLQELDISINSLILSNNNNLLNLNGIEKLTSIRHIVINNNQNLNSVNFPNIKGTSSLSIVGNNSLTSLSGFHNSISLLSSLTIQDNPKLKDLKWILTSQGGIEGQVRIDGNASITSLEGLSFSNRVMLLEIKNNPFLKDISALENLRTITRFLNISNNDQIGSLKGLENLDR